MKQMKKMHMKSYGFTRIVLLSISIIIACIVTVHVNDFLKTIKSINASHLNVRGIEYIYGSKNSMRNGIKIRLQYVNTICPANIFVLDSKSQILTRNAEGSPELIATMHFKNINMTKSKEVEFFLHENFKIHNFMHFVNGLVAGDLILNMVTFVNIRFCLFPLYIYLMRM